jgi:hypothetical protein
VLPLELRVFLGQPAILGWGAVIAIVYGSLWKRHRLGLILGAVFGLVQLIGLFVGTTPYNWSSPFGIVLPLVFAEWLLVPLVMLLIYGFGRDGSRRR